MDSSWGSQIATGEADRAVEAGGAVHPGPRLHEDVELRHRRAAVARLATGESVIYMPLMHCIYHGKTRMEYDKGV